jgi:hypothetical protein
MGQFIDKVPDHPAIETDNAQFSEAKAIPSELEDGMCSLTLPGLGSVGSAGLCCC